MSAAARDIIGEARTSLADPALSDAAAVHDFRKAMKRWRAFLRLIGPFAGPEADVLRRSAAETARGLAGARDRQAALDALADLEGTGGLLAPRSMATIRARLESLRSDSETGVLDAETRSRLTSALREAEAAAPRWPFAAIAIPDFCSEIAKGYGRARRAVPERWADAEADELHELRKRVVVHRYQMELTAPLWRKLAKAWIGEAQRLRDRLGHHQDLNVLAQLAAPHGPLAPWRSRLMPLIAARQAAHVKAARRLAARLFAEKPKAFRARILALWQGADRD